VPVRNIEHKSNSCILTLYLTTQASELRYYKLEELRQSATYSSLRVFYKFGFGREDFGGLRLYYNIYIIYFEKNRKNNMIHEHLILSCSSKKIKILNIYQNIDLALQSPPKFNSQTHPK